MSWWPWRQNPWFETVLEAQRRAKKRLPPSVYAALVAGSERGTTPRDNTDAFAELEFAPHVAGHQAAYGYVVGTWPEFYVQSGLIPASGVLYPSALPGAPATWAYEPPDPSTRKGARLAALQAGNAEQLLSDFVATPPRYILVNPSMAKAPASVRSTDIGVIEGYLAKHCSDSGEHAMNDREYRMGKLYVCTVDRSS